ncbi:MAG TPA: fused MFS/spermidine synthase [Candidatus Kapabacteria bacterium]|nr:fused MFS/spermidine synthase [Candidatus Kapabacteria bacterium]
MKKKLSGKIKNSLSYIMPMRVKNYHSAINGLVEINITDGTKTLDTHSCNYSYGSLQKILQKGLEEIESIDSVKHILILGLGGGSVIQTIREVFHSKAHITAVEIDRLMIDIAQQEFGIDRYAPLTIIHDDAIVFMQHSKQLYNLIIVDVFVQETIPEECLSADFLRRIAQSLTIGGTIIFNTMRDSIEKSTLDSLYDTFKNNGLSVRIIDRVDKTNTLILAKNFHTHSE